MHGATDGEGGWRLPARELEDAVTRTISTFLRDEIRVVDGLALKASTDLLRKMLGRANALAVELGDDRSQDRRPTIQRLVGRITLRDEALRIDLSRAGLLDLIGVGAAKGDVTEESFTITTPLKLKRRGVEAKLIVGAPQEVGAAPNAKLVALLAQAQRWLDLLVSGESETVDQIARREKLDASDRRADDAAGVPGARYGRGDPHGSPAGRADRPAPQAAGGAAPRLGLAASPPRVPRLIRPALGF